MKFPLRPDFWVTAQSSRLYKTETRQESHRSTSVLFGNIPNVVSLEIAIYGLTAGLGLIPSVMFQIGYMTACMSVFQSFWQWLSEMKHDLEKQTLRGLLVVLIAFGDSNEENQWKIIFSSGILWAHTPHPVIKKPVPLLHSNM